MIIDITGVELIPGDDCPGDGMHLDANGDLIECCCEECDYLMCCTEPIASDACQNCTDAYCPHVGKNR